MATRADLVDWVEQALRENGGEASVVDVAKTIWKKYGEELKTSGDLFFTWQYDMRWAALKLRKLGRVKSVDLSKRGMWTLC